MKILRYGSAMLAALTLAGCATSSHTTDSKTEAAAYFAADFTCKAADSASVDLTELTRNPQRYDGKCVSVLGFAKDDALYQDADQAAMGAAKIGLDWNDQGLARRLRLGPSFVNLEGRVRLCSRRQAMAALAAPADPETGCRGAAAALTVSGAEIVPTSMD